MFLQPRRLVEHEVLVLRLLRMHRTMSKALGEPPASVGGALYAREEILQLHAIAFARFQLNFAWGLCMPALALPSRIPRM